MNINPTLTLAARNAQRPVAPPTSQGIAENAEYREAFGQFVGKVFFGQMLKAMRKTVDKPAYFHGGRAEEMFQQQLDQVMADKLGESSSERFAEPMFDLMTLPRR